MYNRLFVSEQQVNQILLVELRRLGSYNWISGVGNEIGCSCCKHIKKKYPTNIYIT